MSPHFLYFLQADFVVFNSLEIILLEMIKGLHQLPYVSCRQNEPSHGGSVPVVEIAFMKNLWEALIKLCFNIQKK